VEPGEIVIADKNGLRSVQGPRKTSSAIRIHLFLQARFHRIRAWSLWCTQGSRTSVSP
jgi:hypothetical protein